LNIIDHVTQIHTVTSLTVLRLASQLMLCTNTWPEVPPADTLHLNNFLFQ